MAATFKGRSLHDLVDKLLSSSSADRAAQGSGVRSAAVSWLARRARRVAVRTLTARAQVMIASGARSDGRPRKTASRGVWDTNVGDWRVT